jgi:hypothetical protein
MAKLNKKSNTEKAQIEFYRKPKEGKKPNLKSPIS